MKRLLYLFIMGMIGQLLLGGCSKGDEGEMSPFQPNTISFSSPILKPVGSHSRVQTGIVTGKYSQTEKFRVFAQWDRYGFKRWGKAGVNGAASMKYLENIPTKFDAQVNGWITCDESGNPKSYDWPLEGGLTFAGYSPADIVSSNYCTSVSYGVSMVGTEEHSGLVIKGFKVPLDISQQVDLMYAKRTYNKRSSTSSMATPDYNGVDLIFHHALSLINFKFQLDKANQRKAFLKKLTMSDVSVEGDFHEWVYESETTLDNYVSDTNHRKWEAVDVKAGSGNVFTIFEAKTEAEEIELQEVSPTTPPFKTPSLMLIPQRFAESLGPGGAILDAPDAKIDIVLRMQDANGAFIPTQKQFKMSQLSAAWQGGKSYTYTVSVGAIEIEFEPGITDWVNADPDGVIVNPS